jgi:hypothetical protein
MSEPLSFPTLVLPAEGYENGPEPRGAISFGSGYSPERMREGLEREFKRMTTEPVPETEAVTIVLDGTAYEGEQMTAGSVRVAAASVERRLLVVSVNGWDGPLELVMVTPRNADADQG